MSCAQTVHALRTLRNHGVTNTTLQIVFKSVAVAKLVYAASALYGFCTAADRDRLEAVECVQGSVLSSVVGERTD